MAGQGARAAGGRIADRGRDDERRREAQSRRYAKIAEEVVEQLGRMKGAAMKFGQVLSTVDLPNLEPEDRERLKEKLAVLRDQAPRVAFKDVERVMREDWGEPPSRVLAELDPEAIAAASIGQVYRGVTKDGRDVAIKVQYPGIVEAVDADLRAARALVPLIKRLSPGPRRQGARERAARARLRGARLRARGAERPACRAPLARPPARPRPARGHRALHPPRARLRLGRRRGLRGHEGARRTPSATAWARRCSASSSLRRARWTSPSATRTPATSCATRPTGASSRWTSASSARSTPGYVDREARIYRALDAGDAGAIAASFRELGYLKGAVDEKLLKRYMLLTGEWMWEVEQPFRLSGDYAADLAERAMGLGPEWLTMVRSFDVPPEALLLRRMENMVFSTLCDLRAAADWQDLAEELRAGLEPRTQLGREHAAWRAGR